MSRVAAADEICDPAGDRLLDESAGEACPSVLTACPREQSHARSAQWEGTSQERGANVECVAAGAEEGRLRRRGPVAVPRTL